MVLSHSLAPPDVGQFEHVAKVIPPRSQEPAVADLKSPVRVFEAHGIYGPFHVRPGDGVIRDRSGEPAFLSLQVRSPEAQHAVAQAGCLALNIQRDAETTPIANAAE